MYEAFLKIMNDKGWHLLPQHLQSVEVSTL